MNGIIKLYKNHRELLLVEIAYLIVTLIAFVVAGVIALFNQSMGVAALVVPLVALIALVMNVVAWAMIKFVLDTLVSWQDGKNTPKAAKK
ncbi:hypothetical protein IKF94_00900 [Candidatus Saccharibacteria bacterium]|nr:hypothetical protein [Candidatus Saccharibacteria bacterium]